MFSKNSTDFERKDKCIFIAHNISETMFINSGHDFEQYHIDPYRFSFAELKKVVEEKKYCVTLKNLISNQAVLNRIREMYQIDLPQSTREKIALQPGDELYVISPIEGLTRPLRETEGTDLPPGVRFKIIKYCLSPRN